MASSSSSHPENAFTGIEPAGKRRMVSEFSTLYDVFINHRGPDVKLTLATQLYNSLEQLGIRVFLGSEEKELGDSVPSIIETVIRSASVHISIFSGNYAESVWCLTELLLMLQSNATIIPVFYQVEPSDLRYIEKGVYAESFRQYEEKGRYLDKLEEWKEALQKVSFVAGYEIKSSDYSDCKDIVSAVEKEVRRRQSLHVARYPVALDKLVKDFERRCLDELVHDFESQCGTKKTNVVGIFGMGGVGKTTLSKELFNQKRSKYSRASFLFDVREACATGKLPSLQSKLLKDIFGGAQTFQSSEEGTSCLRYSLEKSRPFSFLIVLDDIDHVDQLESLLVMDILNRPDNNLVIITTRDVGVLIRAKIDIAYHLKGLDREDGRELFCWNAFGQPHPCSGYEDLVQDFTNICGGLPVSLQVLGRHVHGRPQIYWRPVLKQTRNKLHEDVKQTLKISFDSLDDLEKQIFMDIACFFVDKSITTAMTIWEGSGWSGQSALKRLQEKCLIEEHVSYIPSIKLEVEWKSRQDEFAFKMHAHLRDMGREMANELSYPPRWWHPQLHLRSLELKGFQNILAQTKGRCFHSFVEKSMDCQITYFIGEPEDGFDTSLLWLQLDYLNRRELDVKSDIIPNIPSWIPLQNLQCLRIRNGRLQRLWESQHQAPLQLKELQISETILEEVPDLGLLNNLENVALDVEYVAIKGWSLLESIRMNFSALYWNSSTLKGKFASKEAFGSLIIRNYQQSTEVALNTSPMSILENLEIGNQKLVTKILISGNHCTNLKTLELHHLENLIEINLYRVKTLSSLSVEGCENLKTVSEISDLTNLVELKISLCPELESELFLSSLICLERIRIEGCKNLKRVSGISDLTKLVELNFSECPVLESELLRPNRSLKIGEKCRIRFISNRPEEIEIIDMNKIRFESLNREEKEIFMDIACFFIGKSKKMAMKIWEGSRWEAHHALESLKEKGLVQEIEEKYSDVLEWEWDRIHLGMPDHLRDLGREMADVYRTPRRIWKHEDLKLLESKGGFRNIIDAIKGRCFHSLFDTSMCAQITYFSAESDDFSETSASLLWLKLDLLLLEYPCIPSWIPLQKLQYLFISDGCLNNLWDSRHQAPVYLKELVLRECSLAECTNSIGMLKDLEKLVLTGRNEGMLVDGKALSESLTGLTKLRSLVLRYFALAGEFNLNGESIAERGEPTISDSAADRCISNLQSMEMRRIKLVSKVSISGEYCHNLESLHLDSMGNLIQVDLTLVRTLNCLELRLCEQLKKVSGNFDLPNLVTLNIVKCGELQELPSLEHLRCLERIVIDGCEKLQEITGVEKLQKLQCLHLSGGDILRCIPRLKKLPAEVTSVIGKANHQAKRILDANQFWDVIGEKTSGAIDVSEIGTMSKESPKMLSSFSPVIMCAVVRGSYASETNAVNIHLPWGSIQSNIGGGVWIVTIAINGKTDVADYKELLTVGGDAQIKKWWMVTINKDKRGNASGVFKKIITLLCY